MKAKSMVLIVIALVCGLIASIGISQVMEQGRGTAEAAPTAPIFVALAHIDIGDALDSTNVKLEQWPRDRIPEGAVQNLEQLEARFARQRLYPGEPILDVKLMDSTVGDNSSKIPEGYRVSSIKVTMDSSVSNLLKPGDRVDLIAFFRRSSEVNFTGARTILRDVRVFAINNETERAVDNEGQVTSAKTVSLLVKPHHVEMVALAGNLGKLQLSLRRPDDNATEEYGEITVQDLLNSRNEVADDKDRKRPAAAEPDTDTQVAGTGSSGNFLEFLRTTRPAANDVATAQPPAPSTDAIQSLAAAEPVVSYQMLVLTPQGATHYRWQEDEELPREGLPEAAPPLPLPTTPPALKSSTGTSPLRSGARDTSEVEFSETGGNNSRNAGQTADHTQGARVSDQDAEEREE